MSYLAEVVGRGSSGPYMYPRIVWEKALGPDHHSVAASLDNLAECYRNQGKYAEAEPLYQRALAILEKAPGLDHPDLVPVLEHYARLLRKTDREAEAAKFEKYAKTIRARQPQKKPNN